MINSKSRYVGEIKHQLREGFGIYNYPNKFFQYEGEWKRGKKHGHGKLLMKDGSYYEGKFENGEISGSGIRKWTATGNVYEGEFLKGELNGNGMMKYGNGTVYEGEWNENMKQGEGELTTADGKVYKGSFYKNKKHGDGIEIGRNGEIYEGGWVYGSKQGHGVMKYNDGSLYEGQWRADIFNGEGSYKHCSGVNYQGLWINGRPDVDATMLKIEGDSEIEVEQGQTFDLGVLCTNLYGERSHETGRLLHIMAGIRSTRLMGVSSSRTLSSLEGIEEQQEDAPLISTPFGFEAEPYPIISKTVPERQFLQQQQHQVPEQPSSFEANQLTNDTAQKGIAAQGEKSSRLLPIADKGPEPENVREHTRTGNLHLPEESGFIVGTERTGEAAKIRFSDQEQERTFPFNEILNSNSQIITDEETREKPSNDELLGLTIRTSDGKATMGNLMFPPQSSLSCRGSVLRSSPDSEGRLSVKGKKGENTIMPSNAHGEKEKRKSRMDQSVSDGEKGKELKEKDSKRKKEKKEEKPMEEKYCKPGDYVIIVQDITNPPFLETTLQPAHLYVKVVSKSKKSKNYNRK